MANRRMFSKDIVRSDAFLDLPISSQALYFHLGMEADDRGYINNPKSVIRSIGASVGDLEQLAQKKFILIREESLILIKGWRINNSIQPTRLIETKFIEDLKKLFFDENNSYTENNTGNHVVNNCRQIVDKLSTQVRLGKEREEKEREEKEREEKEREEKEREEISQEIGEVCFQKLMIRKYLTQEDILTQEDKDRYLELIQQLINQGYTKKNICISLNYFLEKVIASKWSNVSKKRMSNGIRDNLEITDKFEYLKEDLNNSCKKFKDGFDKKNLSIKEKLYLESAIAQWIEHHQKFDTSDSNDTAFQD